MKSVEYNLGGKGQGARGKRNARSRFSLAPRPSPLAPGFTLTEILIVIGLMVLMLALALPAFNFITGGRSVDAAQNNLAAMLARARTEAIGLQEIRGLFFFIDPKTPERVSVALVRATGTKSVDDANVDVYLDLVPDTDFLHLPKNVGLQLVDDFRLNGAIVQDDRYIGFNRTNGTAIDFGGAILFDGNGLLKSAYYGFRNSTANALAGPPTAMGTLLFQLPTNTTTTPSDFVPRRVGTDLPPRSQFGLAVFDQVNFNNRSGATASDPQIDAGMAAYTNASAGEPGEETWLDQNATAVLINRYNGTLVKGD